MPDKSIPIKSFDLQDKEARQVLLPYLVGNVFHVTRYASAEKIVESGAIEPNTAGVFGDAFPGSSNGYGRSCGYVCLFDFRNQTDEDLDWGLRCCNFIEATHLGDRISIFVLASTIYDQLISDKAAAILGSKLYVPKVECWYPGPLPLDLVGHRLDVEIRRTPSPPGGLEELLAASFEQD